MSRVDYAQWLAEKITLELDSFPEKNKVVLECLRIFACHLLYFSNFQNDMPGSFHGNIALLLSEFRDHKPNQEYLSLFLK